MKKAVFFDRDGTINVDKHYLYKKEEFEFLSGAVDGMKKLQDMGYLLIIITNQSGIARGYYSEKQYKDLEQWMVKKLEAEGVHISAVYYCPHLPDAPVKEYAVSCKCRKPGIALFAKSIQEQDIDIEKSIVIGDKMRDLEICKNGKTRGVLVYSQKRVIENIVCIEGGISEAADMVRNEENERECKRNT